MAGPCVIPPPGITGHIPGWAFSIANAKPCVGRAGGGRCVVWNRDYCKVLEAGTSDVSQTRSPLER